MIKFARRTLYFDKHPEMRWMDVQLYRTYDEIKFIHWVYKINETVYTFGSPEFKEEFLKAKMWESLSVCD